MPKNWEQMTDAEKLWHLKGETEALRKMNARMIDSVAADQSKLQAQIDELGKRLSKPSNDA
jgi:hypothetical protein